MARKKTESTFKEKIINSAASIAIGEITQHHPKFNKIKNYITNHINSRSLNEMFDKLYEFTQKNRISEDKRESYITAALAKYIVSGRGFDNTGREIILKKSLEEKADSSGLGGFFARRRLKSEKYLDKAIGAWNEVYALIKSGEYEVPEKLEKPMEYLNKLGFAIPAADILKEAGLIDRIQYSQIRGNIKKGSKESLRDATKGLEEYTRYKKITAIILGIAGISLIAFSSKITGAIIGIPNIDIISEAIGAVMVLISLALSLIKRKK